MRLGLALVHTFAWVFIFEYFYILSQSMERALAGTLLLYVAVQFITIVATPVSAAHLQRGVKQSLAWGTLVAGVSFAVLGVALSSYVVPESPEATLWSIVAFAV